MKPRRRDDEEIREFKVWIHSLSVEDLVKAMAFDFIREDDGGAHEYDLLKQMVDSQAPPPTPIHGNALGFRQASSSGPTDGRDDERRIRRDRLERPRLFKLVEREGFGCGSMRMPRSFNRRKENQRKFDVIARKFITASGEVLSIGCTRDQREADQEILLRTHLLYGTSGEVVRCRISSRHNDDKHAILKCLHIVSRGAFLTTKLTAGSRSIPFCSTWLDPTNNFFSLPKYVSSRIEVALWMSFRGGLSVHSALLFHDTAMKLSQDTIKRAWSTAIARELSANIFPTDSKLTTLRDGLMWKLLLWQEENSLNTSFRDVPDKWSESTNLTDIGTNNEKLRQKVLSSLRHEIALQVERDFMISIKKVETANSKIIKKGKRKKKKKQLKERISSVAQVESAVVGLTINRSEEGEDTQVGDYPQIIAQQAPSLDNNNKVLLALSLLNECIDNVFRNVEPLDDDFTLDREIQRSENRVPHQTNETSSCALSAERHLIIAEPSPTQILKNGRINSSLPMNRALDRIENTRVLPFLGIRPAHSVPLSNDTQREEVRADLINFSVHGGNSWNFEGIFDEFDRMKWQQCREKSIFADLFMKDEIPMINTINQVVSSTAMSIVPLNLEENNFISDENAAVQLDVDGPAQIESAPAAGTLIERLTMQGQHKNRDKPGNITLTIPPDFSQEDRENDGNFNTKEIDIVADPLAHNARATQSLFDPQMTTLPPQCSSISASLEGFKTIRASTFSTDFPDRCDTSSQVRRNYSNFVSGSLPSTPTPTSVNNNRTLTSSRSRDDLRITSLTVDQLTKKRGRILQRYDDAQPRKPAITRYHCRPVTLPNALFDSGVSTFSPPSDVLEVHLDPNSHKNQIDRECSRSETAIEMYTEDPHWSENHQLRPDVEVGHVTATEDDSTTISALSKREADENMILEERNTFRDMCLTLGAEVAKLKNLLAVQHGGLLYHGMDYTSGPQDVMQNSSYNQAFTPAFFNGITRDVLNVGAMSDAGVHRGDHDSAVSEDGTDAIRSHDFLRRPRAIHVRIMSSAGTAAASDISVDPPTSNMIHNPSSFRPSFSSFPAQSMQSRLTKDIMNFLKSTSLQLSNQDTRRQAAIERLSRLVTTLWPRSQVKIYGSHVTGLSLPSSDLDFVVCLPAVHKNAPAVAPGVLEGRNAINESSQKLLARKLKGESWIDPRSIKIIDRTVVPVIKVSTKDNRSRMLHLDISFAGPEHHGLEAIEMITNITRELPMVRPLVLVLKQFLIDRSLLTAYTGGLSSYCLFLMLTRYLQEQSTSWSDCGALLMGFLDFYGNSFDPRATGLSVRRRQYFARTIFARKYTPEQPMWNANHQQHHVPAPSRSSIDMRPDFLRRHSFSDREFADANVTGDASRSVHANFGGANGIDASRSVHTMRPPRYQAPYRNSACYPPQTGQGHINAAAHASARPYTFDPLFVEDPLCMGNNVGRNAFRIFQVQRAFSDAHRALLASLEWDNYSVTDLNENSCDYPLLKCLLQSEDVFYDLDDPTHR